MRPTYPPATCIVTLKELDDADKMQQSKNEYILGKMFACGIFPYFEYTTQFDNVGLRIIYTQRHSVGIRARLFGWLRRKLKLPIPLHLCDFSPTSTSCFNVYPEGSHGEDTPYSTTK